MISQGEPVIGNVSELDILLLCNQGYTSVETGSQVRLVTIIIINIESKKNISMSKTFCCVIIVPDLKKGQLSGKIHCCTRLKESKPVHLLFKGW